MNIIKKTVSLLFFASVTSSMEMDTSCMTGNRRDAKASTRVLLGELPTREKNYGCYSLSINYDGSTAHHETKDYCTVSFPEIIPGENIELYPDISGDVTKPSTWQEIARYPRFLIADFTFIPDVTESDEVIRMALSGLECGGQYLLPVNVFFKNAQFVVGTEVGDNVDPGEFAGPDIGFNQALTNYGIPIGEYNQSFPGSDVFTKGSKIINSLVQRTYPTSNIGKAELKPAPLTRAFWDLPQHIQEFLVSPVETRELVQETQETLNKIYWANHSEDDTSISADEVTRHYGKHIEKTIQEDPLKTLLFCINYNLGKHPEFNKKSIVDLAKKHAGLEQDLFGPFFGPNGTPISYSYGGQEFPLFVLPAYIIITKQ